MALTLGKVTILLGAGLLGSVLAKEGRGSNVSDLFSGAFKMVWKQIGQGDSTSAVKSRNNSLIDQVNILRQELQSVAPNTPIIVMHTNSSGTNKFGVVVVVVVVGYGYVWWKGWKLPDMMFATKRGLSDACTTVSKQLEDVYTALSKTRRVLSSKIESVDSKLEECAVVNASTNTEVAQIQERTGEIGKNIRCVRETVQSLGSKFGRIEVRQNITNEGVSRLCDYAVKLESSRAIERVQSSSARAPRPALVERSHITSRTVSLPSSVLPLEPASPSALSDGSDQNQQPDQNAASGSDPMVLFFGQCWGAPLHSIGILKVVGDSTPPGVGVPYANRVPEEPNNGSSNSGLSGRFFKRTLSITQGMISRMQPS